MHRKKSFSTVTMDHITKKYEKFKDILDLKKKEYNVNRYS
jgi:hypothetical protein